MGNVKKIALIISASNFERQKNVVKYIYQYLKKLGGYALYVITSYGLFREESPYEQGEQSIYNLLQEYFFDGCIIEGNLGNFECAAEFSKELQDRGIPVVTFNFGLDDVEDVPFLMPDGYDAGYQLMEHLLRDHHCTKVNVALTSKDDIFSIQLLQACKDCYAKYNLPFDENRVVIKVVSVPNGRELFHIFREKGIDDAEATLCVHDIQSIGLCMEMEEHGYHVPEDMLICSLHRSVNSMAFRPDITGMDKNDRGLCEKICDILISRMEGRKVSIENYMKRKIYYGQSCGCPTTHDEDEAMHYQALVMAKVEAGNQISRMMNFNDSLEGVVSLDELGESVKNLMEGINCTGYILCLNQRAIKYITSDVEYAAAEDGKVFDRTMMAVMGVTKRTGELKDYPFSIHELVPIEVAEGDILIFLPIHHKEQVYGYMVFVNEQLPIDLYNYRICHESIGSSMENLHRQMLLRKSISELDELHMQDALTGLYNRFAWKRFCQKYFDEKSYCVVMIDMDGLKKINDGFGHLAGNNAICITANVIKNSIDEDDLVIRYGGDEFQVLSLNADPEHWEHMRDVINNEIAANVARQKLPYQLGASLGYAICDEQHPMSFEECCEKADQAMYENKKLRKSGR